jgi:hypothetical protein
MRKARRMLLDIGDRRGRPLLFAARVPENLAGCREDGFDVTKWTEEDLVDLFTLGSRTMNVDLQAFRTIVGTKRIKLIPSLDDHHATEGYRHPPIEFFRGVYSNWWRQGADGVGTFNWSAASPEATTRAGINWSGVPYHAHPVHGPAYCEIGSHESMRFKHRLYAVERRGGQPYAEGYFTQNNGAPLPAPLHNDGRTVSVVLEVADDLATDVERFRPAVELSLVLSNANEADVLETYLNDARLGTFSLNPTWTDSQIKFTRPQKLTRIAYPVDLADLRIGQNQIVIRMKKREPFMVFWAQVEKVELAVAYADGVATA